MSIWKKKNVFVMGGLFFLIGTLCLAFLCVNNSNNNTNLEKVNLKVNNEVSKNMFAIMVSKSDESGYEETNKFPNNATFNMELSGCIDANGKKIENALTYSGGIVNAEVESTAYCYLYFDLNDMVCEEGTPLGECINNAKTLGYNSSLEGGLYRYQGQEVDNYICFGTSNKDTCLNNTDAYMYRVIGVDESKRVKLIKNEALNTKYYWHNIYSSNTTWPNSDLYKGLNGISGGKYSNLFIGNTSYMPSGWEDKIETTTWKYGDNTNVNVTADALYNIENAWADITPAKIGLMYAHDYAYAYQSGGLNCSSSGSYSTCKTSWMHISVSDSGAPSSAEWPMSRYGLNGSHYGAWLVTSNGYFGNDFLSYTYSVRPVFYLTSDTLYSSGNGTLNSPFMLQIDEEAPTNNNVLINDGATHTNTTDVVLDLSSTGASQMCISNTDTCSSWEPYATSKGWTLTTGDGTKTVYVWYRDEYGNTSEYVTDTITLDTTAPTSNSVSINSGAASTNSTSVTLTLASTGATQMCISNTTSCSSWVTYTTSKSHTLTSGDGTKTVYVWYRDAAGNQTSYVTDTITLSTATYVCTTNTALGTCLKSAKTAGFNSTMEGGLYRYQGTTANNYICFGTSTKSMCTGNTDAYMYRVIGVNSSGQVKLIKKEALNSTLSWYSDNTNITWPNSTIYTNINGSSFYANTTYVPTTWQSKIATMSWKYGDGATFGETAANLYTKENAFTATISAKIGLMYMHDYEYAYQSGGLNCSSIYDYATCKLAWIFITLNDSGAPYKNEWTMTRYGDISGAYDAMGVADDGGFRGFSLANSASVRPVFFLTSSVNYISGSGTLSDPFIIS